MNFYVKIKICSIQELYHFIENLKKSSLSELEKYQQKERKFERKAIPNSNRIYFYIT